jgi:hypothetical protein
MDDNKKPWFEKKRLGLGIRPNSWQGWLVTAFGVGAEVVTITLAHQKYPSWFVAKTSGSGFSPATWQGWLCTIGPIIAFLALITLIYFHQRQTQ